MGDAENMSSCSGPNGDQSRTKPEPNLHQSRTTPLLTRNVDMPCVDEDEPTEAVPVSWGPLTGRPTIGQTVQDFKGSIGIVVEVGDRYLVAETKGVLRRRFTIGFSETLVKRD